MHPADSRRRVVIESVTPVVDHGTFAAKAIVGDPVVVECDAFADGHDVLRVVLRYRPSGDAQWIESDMEPLDNDRYAAAFTPIALGMWEFSIAAWVDAYASWRNGLERKIAVGQDVTSDLEVGAGLIARAAKNATGAARKRLTAAVKDPSLDVSGLVVDASNATTSATYSVEAERERAAYGAWYEFFPRSTSPEPGRHGTFADAEARLQDIAEMGFDVVYLPPIHPIGTTKRKGRNNAPEAEPGDVGTPWAIGSPDGGHDAVHPELGDFDAFVARASGLGLEIALDLALQCSPDHPWVTEHPEWFKHRPDGTIQYAENPPKRYEDIYPLDFESDDWEAMWAEIARIVRLWIARGIRIFRVDNPHTKSFAFWEWLISVIRAESPDVVFLAEAFTRPKVMQRLAKLGFSQSYTYFTWRTSKAELTEYMTELVSMAHMFRPNFWPNTPDILTPQLQTGAPGIFMSRLILAATLSPSYGIYGPAYELMLSEPCDGVEEYLDNEKYELKTWDAAKAPLTGLISLVNRIRREHPALHRLGTIEFHEIENDSMLVYSKVAGDDALLIVVSLDGQWQQSGWTQLRMDALGLADDETFEVHDLISGSRYLWRGPRNFVQLEPSEMPAHIFVISRPAGTERDFDYYA